MYIWQSKTDEQCTLDNEAIFRPVATLADQYGGRAQISIDDGCYILSLKQKDGKYRYTHWWFREAVAVLKSLPTEPEKARLMPFMEWLLSNGFEKDLEDALRR